MYGEAIKRLEAGGAERKSESALKLENGLGVRGTEAEAWRPLGRLLQGPGEKGRDGGALWEDGSRGGENQMHCNQA